MAGIPPVKKEAPATTTQIHKIRITLSSRNPKALEKVCAELIKGARDHKLQVRGQTLFGNKKEKAFSHV